MTAQTGLAFVIVQHLSPDFKSLMDEFLSRRTFLPVHQVTEGMELDWAKGGLGVGLTLVRLVAELHGGTVPGQSDGPGQPVHGAPLRGAARGGRGRQAGLAGRPRGDPKERRRQGQ
jgi:hypothetical protein